MMQTTAAAQVQDDQQPQPATRVTDAPAQAETAKVIPLSPEEEVQVKDTAASFRRRNNKKQ